MRESEDQPRHSLDGRMAKHQQPIPRKYRNGTRSHHSDIGSKIRVKAVLKGKPLWQMREISAKNGFKSQSELVAHFGLRDASVIDSLVIEWPGGAVQTFADIASDQLMKVTGE